MRALRITMWIACGILVLMMLAGMLSGAGIGPGELVIMDLCLVVLIVGGVALLVHRPKA